METPPLSTLLFTVCFLGIFGFLVMTIPSGFLEASQDRRQLNIPNVFDSIDVMDYAETHNFTLGDDSWENWGKPDFGHDMRFYVNKAGLEYPHLWFISNVHFYGLWSGHKMWWTNATTFRYNYLILPQMVIDWNPETNMSEYTVSCSHFTMKAWITYNTTTYESLIDAWDNNDAHILFAIKFEELGGRWDLWSLITGVLFLQLPDVHPSLNMLFAIPLWICIIWLTFAFIIAIIKSLPFT